MDNTPEKDTLQYQRYRTVFNVGSNLMKNCPFCVFEGLSDVRFYAPFIEVDPKYPQRRCEFARGKENVERGINAYGNALESAKENGYTKAYAEMSFFLDRDYDVLLKKDIFRQPFVRYQMWREENGVFKGYNDLESFLISTGALTHVLEHYGVDASHTVEYRNAIISAASCVGVFRIASRYAQGEDDSAVLYRMDGNSCPEIDVQWFCEQNFFEFGLRSVNFDLDSLYDLVESQFMPNNSETDLAKRVICALNKAKELLSDDFEADIRYCRGHDLTELLFTLLLRETECSSYPESVEEVESVLSEIPKPGSARNNLLSKLRGYPIFQDFDPKTFDEYWQGKR